MESLIGVLVGAAISAIIPWYSLKLQREQWKQEQQLIYYKIERDRLEELFESLRLKIIDGMKENSYPIEMISTLMIRCPDGVSEAFSAMMNDKNKDAESKKNHYLKIAIEINKSLKLIDTKIENIIDK
jgi:hypothetical protein